MLPQPYNNNYQVLQTPDHVVIVAEMIHDARIIPLDGRPHLPSHVRQWMGDSVGSLGRRHARRRNDELHRRDQLSRRGREPAPGGALHAHRARCPSLSGDHRRSDDVHAAVDDRAASDAV